MGCVSSSLLEDDDVRIVGPKLISHHHIVSLTSTTYGLLATLDQPSSKSQSQESQPQPSDQPQSQNLEIINSWELMAGLDPVQAVVVVPKPCLDSFPSLCPPGGEDSLIVYTTSLRGIRRTFEECNAVRSAIEGLGVVFKERDVSMDLGFREELRELLMVRMKGGGGEGVVINVNVPQVFIKGRYIGGVESVLRIHEEGGLAELVQGLARRAAEEVCDGCGGVRFLPCFTCSGSRKLVLSLIETQEANSKDKGIKAKARGKLVRCGDCNENGLVLCPICS